jgi:ectoine hydroxylase-related dioxygenase (phytanoyl-CoA dioxygenase family)
MTAIFKPFEVASIVDLEYQKAIYSYLTNVEFDWHFMNDATDELANNALDNSNTPGFGNLIYYHKHEHNPHLEFFQPLVDAVEKHSNLKINKLLRVRAGFLLNTKYVMHHQPYKHNTPHRDYEQEHYTVVYYVTQSDGETVVFHETEKAEKYYPMHKSMPEPGKMLVFNGLHYHASTCPKMFTKRIAITINFAGQPND